MELYLERCLNSLVIPSIDCVEIIIVNDGSKDGTLRLAEGFKLKHPESVIIIDKKNGNYGSCINAGLKVATGKYVKILDADDFFDTDVFQSFVELLTNLSVDTILTNFSHVNNLTSELYYGRDLRNVGFPIEKIIGLDTAMKHLDYPLMHLITYRRELLLSIGYVQTEGASYTDTEWCFLPFAMSSSFIYLPVSLYRYVIGREGQTVSKEAWLKSNKSFFKIIVNMIKVYERVLLDCDNTQKAYLTNYLNVVYLSVLKRNIESKDPLAVGEFREFDNELKTSYKKQYDYWASLPMSSYSNWPIVAKWRASSYAINFKVPARIKLLEQFVCNIRKTRRKLALK